MRFRTALLLRKPFKKSQLRKSDDKSAFVKLHLYWKKRDIIFLFDKTGLTKKSYWGRVFFFCCFFLILRRLLNPFLATLNLRYLLTYSSYIVEFMFTYYPPPGSSPGHVCQGLIISGDRWWTLWTGQKPLFLLKTQNFIIFQLCRHISSNHC